MGASVRASASLWISITRDERNSKGRKKGGHGWGKAKRGFEGEWGRGPRIDLDPCFVNRSIYVPRTLLFGWPSSVTGKWTESAHTPPHNRKDEILYARCCNRSFGKKVSRETGKEGSLSHSESIEAILLLPFNLVIKGREGEWGQPCCGDA